jgi:hypothetical protein
MSYQIKESNKAHFIDKGKRQDFSKDKGER